MASPRNTPRAVGFSLWAICISLFLFDITWFLCGQRVFVLAIPFVLFMGSVEMLLVLRTAWYLSISSSHIDRLHRFFYESKEGSYLLAFLCVIWVFGLAMVLPVMVLSGISGGWPRLESWGVIFSLLALFLQLLFLISVLTTPLLMIWLIWTAVMAMRRVRRIVRAEETGAEFHISPDNDENEDWEGWRDNLDEADEQARYGDA